VNEGEIAFDDLEPPVAAVVPGSHGDAVRRGGGRARGDAQKALFPQLPHPLAERLDSVANRGGCRAIATAVGSRRAGGHARTVGDVA
jgi:hypothetical protein